MFCWIVYNESITVYHFRYTHKANIIKSSDFSINYIEFDNEIQIIIEPSSLIYLDVVLIRRRQSDFRWISVPVTKVRNDKT